MFRGVTSGSLARRGVRVEPADLPSNRSQLRNERTFSDAHCRGVIGFLPKIRSTRSVVAASRPSRIARHNATCASVSSCEPLARSKGVAKCLNWREILLALPDWDCFSAPSTNRDLLDSFFFLSQHFVDCLAQLASCGERNSLIQDCYAFPSSTRHSSLRERMRRRESVKSPDPDPPHFARRLDPVKHGFHTSPARTSVRGYR